VCWLRGPRCSEYSATREHIKHLDRRQLWSSPFYLTGWFLLVLFTSRALLWRFWLWMDIMHDDGVSKDIVWAFSLYTMYIIGLCTTLLRGKTGSRSYGDGLVFHSEDICCCFYHDIILGGFCFLYCANLVLSYVFFTNGQSIQITLIRPFTSVQAWHFLCCDSVWDLIHMVM